MEKLMSYEKFKYLMELLLDFQKKKDKISDFFEKELMEESFCFITFGNPIEAALINLIADEFNCWYSFRKEVKDFVWWTHEKNYNFENEIESWLFSLDEEKAVWINDKKIDISSIESLYDYLVTYYNKDHNLTK